MKSRSGMADLVVIGAGQAAAELTMSARQEGYAGRILLIGAEPQLPYQRPPLSKGLLAGAATPQSLLLKARSAYDEARVELQVGAVVTGIDRARKHVLLQDGSKVGYQHLALTLGGRPRRAPSAWLPSGAEPSNVHYLRTVDDAQRLRSQLDPSKRLVIIGGGYIGLEVAATAMRLGVRVTVLEAMPRVMARVTAPEISAFYERMHRDAGVDVRTGVKIAGFDLDASGTHVTAVRCRPDACVDADVVLVGIGIEPNTELAQAAGLHVDGGIVVDELGRTSDPDILAAGDCTMQSNDLFGCRVRLESVPNAIEQARCAAATLCGKQRPCNPVPWFWSEQFDTRLQVAGLARGYDQCALRGSYEERSFALFYMKDGRLIAADAVNRPQEFMMARKLIAERAIVDPRQLMDDAVPAKLILQHRRSA